MVVWVDLQNLPMEGEGKTPWFELMDVLRRRGFVSQLWARGWDLDELERAFLPLMATGRVQQQTLLWSNGELACVCWCLTKPVGLSDRQRIILTHRKQELRKFTMQSEEQPVGTLCPCRVRADSPLAGLNDWYPEGLPLESGVYTVSGHPLRLLDETVVTQWSRSQYESFNQWAAHEDAPGVIAAVNVSMNDAAIPVAWLEWEVFFVQIPDEIPDWVSGIQPLSGTHKADHEFLNEGYHYRARVRDVDSSSEFNLCTRLEAAGFQGILLPPGV